MSYLEKNFADLGSPNKLKVSMGHGAKAWVSDFNHPHYMAGRKAMKTGERLSANQTHTPLTKFFNNTEASTILQLRLGEFIYFLFFAVVKAQKKNTFRRQKKVVFPENNVRFTLGNP